jgi:predicted Fe-Mo cluster-binding NifX family protein
MIVAIPMKDGRPTDCFAQSDATTILDIDLENRTAREHKVVRREDPGDMVQWLRSLMVDTVLVGSMSYAEQDRLAASRIKVYPGGSISTMDGLVSAFVRGELTRNLAMHAGPLDPELFCN